MLRQFVESWSRVPHCLRAVIGLQVTLAGWLAHTLAGRMGTANDAPAGFTIGLGVAIAALAVRSRLGDNGATDGDGE
jgi:hypothetical protein